MLCLFPCSLQDCVSNCSFLIESSALGLLMTFSISRFVWLLTAWVKFSAMVACGENGLNRISLPVLNSPSISFRLLENTGVGSDFNELVSIDRSNIWSDWYVCSDDTAGWGDTVASLECCGCEWEDASNGLVLKCWWLKLFNIGSSLSLLIRISEYYKKKSSVKYAHGCLSSTAFEQYSIQQSAYTCSDLVLVIIIPIIMPLTSPRFPSSLKITASFSTSLRELFSSTTICKIINYHNSTIMSNQPFAVMLCYSLALLHYIGHLRMCWNQRLCTLLVQNN